MSVHRNDGVVFLSVVREQRVRPTDCEHGPRPCPETGCRYHLEHGGESCAIDVAEQGPQTIRRVAALLGVSHVRVLQIVRRAYIRARAKGLPRR